MPERELTRTERADIRALVKASCANYDYQYGCLPLDCPCYMLNKWWTGAYCKYFHNAVLPLNPALEASLMGSGDLKPCEVCGTLFSPVGRQAFCSEPCRAVGRRKTYRSSKNKTRRNKR